MDFTTKLETLLSDILSDQFDCKITLRFEPRDKDSEKGI